jgi:hypothetical protein
MINKIDNSAKHTNIRNGNRTINIDVLNFVRGYVQLHVNKFANLDECDFLEKYNLLKFNRFKKSK